MEVLFNQADSSLHFCCRLHITDTQAAVQQKMRLLCDHLWELKGKTRCSESMPGTDTNLDCLKNAGKPQRRTRWQPGRLRPLASIWYRPTLSCSLQTKRSWNAVKWLREAIRWGLFLYLISCDCATHQTGELALTGGWRYFEEKALSSLYDSIFWKCALCLHKTASVIQHRVFGVRSCSKNMAWRITLTISIEFYVICTCFSKLMESNNINNNKDSSTVILKWSI